MYDYVCHNIYSDMYNFGKVSDKTFLDVSECVINRLLGKNGKEPNDNTYVQNFNLNNMNKLKKKLFLDCIRKYGDSVYDAAHDFFPDYEIIFYAYLSRMRQPIQPRFQETKRAHYPEEKHSLLFTMFMTLVVFRHYYSDS